jgi:hypothetical protein
VASTEKSTMMDGSAADSMLCAAQVTNDAASMTNRTARPEMRMGRGARCAARAGASG